MKNKPGILLFVLFTLLLAFSCKKKQEESCGTEMILVGKDTVYEGETIGLTPIKCATGTNADFNWTFPDMSPFPTGMSDDDSPVKVENATIFDEGLYSLVVFPKEDGCPDVTKATKYVRVLPLPCPCCETVYENNLQVTSSQGDVTLHHFDPIFESDFDTTYFTVSNWQSSGPYYLDLRINTRLTDKDRTFKLMNYISYWTGSGFPEDPVTQAWLGVNPATEPENTSLMEEGVNNLYIRHDGDQVTLNFCNVVFRHKYNSNQYYTVSGKVYLEF